MGPGEGVRDKAAQAQRGDYREDAGDVVGAVGEELRSPEPGELLLVLAIMEPATPRTKYVMYSAKAVG